jgi:hypothetical protein
MNISTGNSANNNDCTTEKMGTEQCNLSKKTAQIGDECLDNEQRVHGTVLTDSVIDEKSNEVSVNVADNSVIQLPEPPRPYSENACQTLESSRLQESTSEQVCLSDDKSEIKCPQNVNNEAGETSDAVPALVVVVQEQTQSVPAQVNSDSVNEPLDPPSGDVTENIKSEPGEMSDAVTGFVEDHKQSVPAQVNTDSVNELLDMPSGDVMKNISSKNEAVEMSDAVTDLVEDQTQSVPAQVNTSAANNEPLDTPSGDAAKISSSDCSERKSNNSPQLREKHAYKKNSKLSKKYILRSLGSSDRTLRSRTKDNKPKDPEPINTVDDVNNDEMKTKERKRRKKKKTRKEGINDQYSRIRAQLRYYLNRISYEQNLIDAYSTEGWRGSRYVNFTVTL